MTLPVMKMGMNRNRKMECWMKKIIIRMKKMKTRKKNLIIITKTINNKNRAMLKLPHKLTIIIANKAT
jgi:hypothetical protein